MGCLFSVSFVMFVLLAALVLLVFVVVVTCCICLGLFFWGLSCSMIS